MGFSISGKMQWWEWEGESSFNNSNSKTLYSINTNALWKPQKYIKNRNEESENVSIK